MPLTPRDRRTLMIGGGILGVLLVAFLLFNMLSGGGDDGAIPIAAADHRGARGGGGGSDARRSRRATGSARSPVFTGRDPFSIPPALSPAAADGDRQPAAPPTERQPPARATAVGEPPARRRPPPSDAGRGLQHRAGRQDRRAARQSSSGDAVAQFEVDGTVFNNVGIGDTFGGGRSSCSRSRRLRHVPVRRRVFHPLRELDQVGARSRDRSRRPAHGGSGRRLAGAAPTGPPPHHLGGYAFGCLSRRPRLSARGRAEGRGGSL